MLGTEAPVILKTSFVWKTEFVILKSMFVRRYNPSKENDGIHDNAQACNYKNIKLNSSS
jgi:hypothetical protein